MISYPLKEVFMTQPFGNKLIQNGKEVYARYGWKGHNGEDYRARTPKELYAPCDGYCKFVWSKKAYGNHILFFWEEGGKKYQMILAHCSQLVGVDRYVKRGEYIGLTGNTGFSFSPHLHLDIREIDPKTGATLNKGNGYGGAIDPAPFWTNTNLIQLMTDYIATLAEERAKPGNEGISIFQSIAGDGSLDEKNIKALIEIAFLRAIPIIINKIK